MTNKTYNPETFRYNSKIDGRKLYEFIRMDKKEFYLNWAYLSSGEMVTRLCASTEVDARGITRSIVKLKLSEMSDGQLLWRHCSRGKIKHMLAKIENLTKEDIVKSIQEDQEWYEQTLKENGIRLQNFPSRPQNLYDVLKQDYGIDMDAEEP